MVCAPAQTIEEVLALVTECGFLAAPEQGNEALPPTL
jgi:hypothetical protein